MTYNDTLEYYAQAHGSFDLMEQLQINLLINTKLEEYPILKAIYKEPSLRFQIHHHIENELFEVYWSQPSY